MENLITEFNGKLAQHLKCGQYFDIDVKFIEGPKSFHISLSTAKLNGNSDADIGLHILVNFSENQISANSRHAGQWRKPTVAEFNKSGNPKECVKINIQLWNTCFHISINGEQKLEMFYRIENDVLEAIQIGGDIKQITRVDHRQVFPEIWPLQCVMDVPEDGLFMYFSNDIPIKFQAGHLIVITGHCFGGRYGRGFHINIKHAHKESLMMKFDVNFVRKIVRRSTFVVQSNRIYDQSDFTNTSEGFPFDMAKPLRIGIACTETEFLIAVNGSYFCSYTYRTASGAKIISDNKESGKAILSNVVGVKIFGVDETGFKISEFDHHLMETPKCTDFVKYTKIN